jgi:hypothetical protein
MRCISSSHLLVLLLLFVRRPDRLPGSRLTSLADGLQLIACDPRSPDVRPRRRGHCGMVKVLRKIDGASQDRASTRVCLTLGWRSAAYLEPEPGRAAADRSTVWPVARQMPDFDDGFNVPEKYTAQG